MQGMQKFIRFINIFYRESYLTSKKMKSISNIIRFADCECIINICITK